MTRYILARVGLGIAIVIGGTFFVLYMMFESLGIGEYVWPILWPILGGTFGIMALVCIVSAVACNVNQGVPSDKQMIRRTYAQPMYRTGDYAEGSVYTVPVYCPHCKYKLEMDQVEWVGSSELTCPNCFRVVEAGIREHL
ncbi:MAG: hypothetical protein RTV41_07940 [Candidatus Thorarchaeota archaeon]